MEHKEISTDKFIRYEINFFIESITLILKNYELEFLVLVGNTKVYFSFLRTDMLKAFSIYLFSAMLVKYASKTSVPVL